MEKGLPKAEIQVIQMKEHWLADLQTEELRVLLKTQFTMKFLSSEEWGVTMKSEEDSYMKDGGITKIFLQWRLKEDDRSPLFEDSMK